MCLSRAKRLLDLLVEPTPLDRLSKLGEKPTLKLRLEEKVRLKTVAVETLLRHGVRVPYLRLDTGAEFLRKSPLIKVLMGGHGARRG